MTTVQEVVRNHRAVSETFLVHAQTELDKGDLLQASEKAWGAVAHFIKAIAKDRGWHNDTHADVMRIGAGLVGATKDVDQQRTRFLAVRALHQNFYENELDGESVQSGIGHARKLLDALKEAEPNFPTRQPRQRHLPSSYLAERDNPGERAG